ncbi:expressed protein [Phakopsora pachyrhizi]|uniref:Expressed protein n=1 Tax=Phakopsora pachyrhizi TaxID=170000 RepID=A0AAV0BND5_PHAPC|nr:expressed protein [Phakopsora pachyrhizi]CAH7687686.1 expressed protein [Phakopsora pachyrhizi]
MAGPRMELFKFGMYVFFPIAIMIHYGDPEWYQKYVLPDKSDFLRLEKMKTVCVLFHHIVYFKISTYIIIIVCTN